MDRGVHAAQDSSSCGAGQFKCRASAPSARLPRTHARTSWRQTPAAAVPPPRRPGPPHQSALHTGTRHNTACTAHGHQQQRESQVSANADVIPANQCRTGAGAGVAAFPCTASQRQAGRAAHRCGRAPCWQTAGTPCAAAGQGDAARGRGIAWVPQQQAVGPALRRKLVLYTRAGMHPFMATEAAEAATALAATALAELPTCVLLRVVNTISASDRKEASMLCSFCRQGGGAAAGQGSAGQAGRGQGIWPRGGSCRCGAPGQNSFCCCDVDSPPQEPVACPALLCPALHYPAPAHPARAPYLACEPLLIPPPPHQIPCLLQPPQLLAVPRLLLRALHQALQGKGRCASGQSHVGKRGD